MQKYAIKAKDVMVKYDEVSSEKQEKVLEEIGERE